MTLFEQYYDIILLKKSVPDCTAVRSYEVLLKLQVFIIFRVM